MKKKNRRFCVSLSALAIAETILATGLAVTFCIGIFATVYSRSISHNAGVNAEQTVQQATVFVDNSLSSMQSQLQNIRTLIRQNENDPQLENRISALTAARDDIFSVTVYSENGEILFSAGSPYTRKSSVYRDLSFDRELFEASPDFSVSAPHVQSIFEGSYPWVVTVACKNEVPLLENGTYLAVDFRFSLLADYIDKIGVGEHGYCYITDPSGEIVYHPQQQVLFAGLKNEDPHRAALADGVNRESRCIVAVQTTRDNRWKVIGVSYTDEMAAERSTQIFISILASLFCCALVVLITLFFYQRFVTKPTRRLIRAMKRFEKQTDGPVDSPDGGVVTELSDLCNSFSQMTLQIRALMEKVRTEETELRKTELKALQAQINPHFLYNTLDSIQWMCEQGQTDDAGKMVSALASLFRISISKGHELIPIERELKHAESYLIIQSYRYKDQFTYRFCVDKSLTGYLCNKITLQPLIENAIYHGLDRMVDQGEIVISLETAPDCPDDLLLRVRDNGIGMSREKCREILEHHPDSSNGIGVKNVNDRLKITFGESYGLTIDSEPDEGTCVTVRIPKIKEEPKP